MGQRPLILTTYRRISYRVAFLWHLQINVSWHATTLKQKEVRNEWTYPAPRYSTGPKTVLNLSVCSRAWFMVKMDPLLFLEGTRTIDAPFKLFISKNTNLVNLRTKQIAMGELNEKWAAPQETTNWFCLKKAFVLAVQSAITIIQDLCLHWIQNLIWTRAANNSCSLENGRNSICGPT